jgi:hypothetical protein
MEEPALGMEDIGRGAGSPFHAEWEFDFKEKHCEDPVTGGIVRGPPNSKTLCTTSSI